MEKKIRILVIVTLILVSLFLAMCVGTCVNDMNKESTGVDTIALQVRAESNAKTAVKSILKSPSTAEFDNSLIRIWLMPDSSVVVKGAVDAQNSFGAMIRSNFYVRMKWKDDFRDAANWTLIDAKLE
ncbi:MAG: hypothetical protein PHH37_08395 [Paludibacter sp.]|nr:hypothetical protein [Paludibacter sp.]